MASSLYLDELNDQLRNEMYCDSLTVTVRKGDHVLDIGTGSGLLSCLAVKALQDQGIISSACYLRPYILRQVQRL